MNRRTFASVALAGVAAVALSACSREPQAPTINQVFNSNASFSTLAAGLQAAGLDGALDSGGPFTVFAPRNSAFDALPEGALDDLLLPENRETLEAILKAHVVEGTYSAADLTGATTTLTTLNGTNIRIDGFNGVVLEGGGGGSATVVQPDVNARNGVIHVINGVLLP